MLAACRARGVAIHENEAVIRVAEDGGSIESAAGRYEGEGVIIAAGAWSSGLFPNLPPCRPVRGHLVGWQMPPGFLGPIVRHNGTYILQRSSGLLIAGSSSEDAGFDRTLDENVIADIERRAAELVPELRDITPVERWNRSASEAVDGRKDLLISRIPGTAVFTAFGHYRNGILLALETARLIAELDLADWKSSVGTGLPERPAWHSIMSSRHPLASAQQSLHEVSRAKRRNRSSIHCGRD